MASNSPSSKNTLPQASNHQKPHQGDCVVGFVKVSTNDSQFAQEMWMSPYIPHGQTFPDFYKIKPKPNPKALEAGPVMSTYFGGPIYDETTKSWLKTYLVQEGGKLLVESPTEYPVAQLAGRDKHKSKQARMALESITQAAGKLWVPICTCRSQPSEQLSAHKSCNHSLITMSGFWLQGDKFVTAAHFLDIQEGVQDHQKSDTITYLKCLKHLDIDDSANGLRARVSSEVWAAREQDYDNGDDMRVFHVYLHSLNSEADIAIFRILPGEKHRPQHAIREDQLSTSAAMNPHTLHNALFSVFYAGNDRPIAEYRTSDPLKEAKAWTSGCEKVFEFLARDSAKQQKLSNRDTMHVPVGIPCLQSLQRLTRLVDLRRSVPA
ncbi:hypothetical protein, variant 2 [Exophiala xenobiotica]|uniref:Uncharacterized protein n=1 Tax=Exophiala xenobiotica TaxID=348802 RepID=A0A0D2EVD1_9EURO|nr:hypothetical protein, variant 2 [Exophiala xenobiotica]KIW58730.1 hypothetical protein, variant 2 [Exophiala xenobiotica]